MENSKRVFEKNTIGKNIHHSLIDNSHLLSAMLVKGSRKLHTEPGLELTLTVTGLKAQWFYASSH